MHYETFNSKYSIACGILMAMRAMGRSNPTFLRLSQKYYHQLKNKNLPEKDEEVLDYLDNVIADMDSDLDAIARDGMADFNKVSDETIDETTEAPERPLGGRIDKDFLTNLAIDLNTSEDVNDFLENL